MDPNQFDAILGDIASGDSARQSLATRAADARGFWRHLASDEEAAQQYARARARGMERWAEEILDIADETEAEAAATGKARLQIDSRKWLLSKLAPKKYGDKVDLTHAGPDGGAILHEIRRTVIDPRNTDA